ncbi:MAG TPA: hypothetical protein PLO69_14215, partial [Gammaproteobacteria bacterium]|nr:hypothetical protein [Gammaproteobacteria bacterium]
MMLTHQQGARMRIDTALAAVGVASRDRARARRELQVDGPKLAVAGVLLDPLAGAVLTRPAPGPAGSEPNLTRPAPEPTRPAP